LKLIKRGLQEEEEIVQPVYAVNKDIDFEAHAEGTIKCDDNHISNKEDKREMLPLGFDIALTNWPERLPEESLPKFPRTFQDLLNLMNDLIEERGSIYCWEELCNHRRLGNQKGIKTQHTLRDLKKKQGYLHPDRGEWCPRNNK
jgi:hypothetical protein